MKQVTLILLALTVPLACANADPTGRETSGQRGIADNNPNDQPNEPPAEEPGEGEGEGEEPGVDAGGGGADAGGGGTDAGGGGTDAGGGGTDTGGGGTVDAAPPPPPPRTPQTFEVAVNNNVFAPSTLTIHVGDTVKWDWEASGHTVTSGAGCADDGRFNSGLRNDGASYSQTFTAAGSYDYHCIPHCSMGMLGLVIVEE